MATTQTPLSPASFPLNAFPLNAVLDGLLLETSPALRALGLIEVRPLSEIFGVSRPTLYREIQRGFLVGTYFNGRLFFTRENIIRWCEGWQARPTRRGRKCASKILAGGVSA